MFDLTLFDDDKTINTVHLVTNRVDSDFKDYGKDNDLTADCTQLSNTKCHITGFKYDDLTNAQVKAGVSIPGYVKVIYTDTSVAFSHFTIQLLRKLHFHHLNLCFSLRWSL